MYVLFLEQFPPLGDNIRKREKWHLEMLFHLELYDDYMIWVSLK